MAADEVADLPAAAPVAATFTHRQKRVLLARSGGRVLATVVPLVIVAFAIFYVAVSNADPDAFSEPVTKVNGLYFTVTVLSTVGFGDIAPRADGSRIAVTVQILVDLLLVGVLVRVIIGASRIAVERRKAEAQGNRPSDR